MGEKVIPILCYMEGDIRDGVHGKFYGKPFGRIIFQEGRGFDELKKVLNDGLFGNERGDGELEITYLFPATYASASVSSPFVHLPLQNDNDVKFMTTIATQSQVPSCVELCIKRSETLESSGDPTISLRRKWLQGRDSATNLKWDIPSTLFDCQDWEDSYEELPRLMNILTRTNEGTQVEWDLTVLRGRFYSGFRRVFWSFGAAIEGFRKCRPLIQVDGIPLSGKYKGRFLLATSVDSNGRIYHLAFAVVEEENDDSWAWFLWRLQTFVICRDGICLISNMHEGILSIVNKPMSGWEEPRAYHRLCLQHVATNFDEKYKRKELKELMYRAGCQHQRSKYEQCMNELEQLNPECLSFFTQIEKEKWAQSYDNGYRYGLMTTNLAECMKGVLEEAIKLPITALVQLTFYHSASIFAERRAEIQAALSRGDSFTKYALDKMSKWEEKANSHVVITLDKMNKVFQVVTKSSSENPSKHMVTLKDKTCTCNKWQSFGIPCSHVIAACLYCRIDYWGLIEDYYKLSIYKLCYSPQFQPIPQKDDWPRANLSVRHPDDVYKGIYSTKTRCGLCKQVGHNRRYCLEGPNEDDACANMNSSDLVGTVMDFAHANIILSGSQWTWWIWISTLWILSKEFALFIMMDFLLGDENRYSFFARKLGTLAYGLYYTNMQF